MLSAIIIVMVVTVGMTGWKYFASRWAQYHAIPQIVDLVEQEDYFSALRLAQKARRYSPEVRRYYDRKQQRTNKMVAHSAVAHKLARAAYYMMRDRVEFSPDRCFGKRSRDGEPAVALV